MVRFTVAPHFLISVLLCLFAANSDALVSKQLNVTLAHGGGVIGRYITSFRGRGILAFYNIPYAEPPVGRLRFADPVRKKAWIGHIDAVESPKVCPHGKASGLGQITPPSTGEDCLYLDVFVPAYPKQRGPLPVMIYFHPGGFVAGSKGAPFAAPDYLLDRDVILVSGNYRVGALGFLSLGSAASPGNFGLKDQSLLLRWVRDQIACFNGSPKDVTLFGLGAGGASVHYHMLSLWSSGLFGRAIIQGGTAFSPWAFDHKGKNLENAKRLGSELNCTMEVDDPQFIECLRNATTEQLIQATDTIADPNALHKGIFLPVGEPKQAFAFLTKPPSTYTDSHGLEIPLIIGFAAQAGAIATIDIYLNQTLLSEWSNRQVLFVEDMSNIPTEEKDTIDFVKSKYFQDGEFDEENFQNITNMVTDAWYFSPTDELLENRLEANKDSAATFVYLFNNVAEVSVRDILAKYNGKNYADLSLGVYQGDDILPLMPMLSFVLPRLIPAEKDDYMIDDMVELWTNFASNSNPNTYETIDYKWLPATQYPIGYLRIGTSSTSQFTNRISMEYGLLAERMAIWRKVRSRQAEGIRRKTELIWCESR